MIEDKIEICSSFEAGIGLSKLVEYTVSPPRRPVVAVMGLECSSHTSIISPVAGHERFDLIQISRAISPIFETENSHNGSVQLDKATVLILLYNYLELAKDTEQKIKASSNKTVTFSLGRRGTKAYYLDAVISNIKSRETGVLIKLITHRQLHTCCNTSNIAHFKCR